MDAEILQYVALLRRYLEGSLSVEEFQSDYFYRFKRESSLSEKAYVLLDQFFGDLDSFTTDQSLMDKSPNFYIDANQLRDRAMFLLEKLEE